MMKILEINQEKVEAWGYDFRRDNLLSSQILGIRSDLALIGKRLGFYTMLATVSESWEHHVRSIIEYRITK